MDWTCFSWVLASTPLLQPSISSWNGSGFPNVYFWLGLWPGVEDEFCTLQEYHRFQNLYSKLRVKLWASFFAYLLGYYLPLLWSTDRSMFRLIRWTLSAFICSLVFSLSICSTFQLVLCCFQSKCHCEITAPRKFFIKISCDLFLRGEW